MRPDAGGQKCRLPIWIPKCRRLWGCYPDPPPDRHSVIVTEKSHLFTAYSGAKELNVFTIMSMQLLSRQ